MSIAFVNHILGDLCELTKGTSPTLKTQPGEYPLVVTAEFRRTADSFQIIGPAVCIPLVSSTGHGDAALHRIHYQEGKFALANLLVALMPRRPDVVVMKYLYWYLMTKKDQLLVPLMQGTANVSLKERDIAGVVIPLPPIAEQRRIVARIEVLAAKIAEARCLRQTSTDEAKSLIGAATDTVLQKLSGSSPVVLLADCTELITDGDHLTPPFSDEGVKFIFVGNVSSGKLHFSGAKFVEPAYFTGLKAHRKPRRGDVLFSAVGATLGIPAIVNCDDEFCFQRHIALIRPDARKVGAQYLWHMLRSRHANAFVWKQTTGSAQPTIPLRAIRQIAVPLPPLAEQRRIVSYLDAVSAKADSLKQLQSASAAKLDALLPSVLDRAFKGEL